MVVFAINRGHLNPLNSFGAVPSSRQGLIRSIAFLRIEVAIQDQERTPPAMPTPASSSFAGRVLSQAVQDQLRPFAARLGALVIEMLMLGGVSFLARLIRNAVTELTVLTTKTWSGSMMLRAATGTRYASVATVAMRV